ncbi:hypothetical protein D3C84_485130 [compost metagenome]
MAPPPPRLICSTASRLHRAGETTLVCKTACHSSGSASKPFIKNWAALFTNPQSGLSRVREMVANNSWTCSTESKSATNGITPANLSVVSRSKASSRSTAITQAPQRDNSDTTARPMPDAPPVTTIPRPFSAKSRGSSPCASAARL